MTDCPFCQCMFTEGYHHTSYNILICPHCYRRVKGLRQHRSFIYFSLLLSSIKKQHKIANRKLRQYRMMCKEAVERQFNYGIVRDCFETCVEQNQKSDRISIVTQDTQAPLEALFKEQKNTTAFVVERCRQTVTALASRIEPTKERMAQSREAVLEKTEALKDKYRSLRQQFRVIKAEMPPVDELAREAKKKLGSFLKFF